MLFPFRALPCSYLALVFALISTPTNTTDSSIAIVRNKILGRERVPAMTMSLQSLACRETVSAPDVLSVSDNFKVRGIHASAILAQMIYFEARRDRSDESGIRLAMNRNRFAFSVYPDTGATVPFLIGTKRPQPTLAGSKVALELGEPLVKVDSHDV